MFNLYEQWKGLVPLFCGIYGLLLAYRIIQKKPKNPKKMQLWHRKFGKMMKILGPILILSGILELLGIFN